MAEETTTATTTDDKGKDAAYWQDEAKKAFKDRDAVKARLREMEGQLLSDEDRQLFDTLKSQQAELEEKRKRAEGQFDELKTQLVTKHDGERKTWETKHASLSQRFQATVINAEFGRATDLFGGHAEAKTILDVDLAIAALGRYVSIEDDEHDPRGYRLVVKSPKGERILGSDGNPKPFAEAISDVIGQLPNKDRILRGSGKTGSGSSGGSGSTGPLHEADLAELTKRARAGDKEAIEALRRRRAGSNALQMGSALTATR